MNLDEDGCVRKYLGSIPRMSDRSATPVHAAGDELPLLERPDGVRCLLPLHARAFLGLVRAGEVLDRALDADLERAHGLGLRAYEVLLHLAAFAPEGRLRMTQLSDQAPLSQSRVSRLVADLERQGLVSRTACLDDARGVLVAITDEGRMRLVAIQGTHHEGLRERLFSRLTDDEMEQLAAITDKILDRHCDDDPSPGAS